MGGIPARGFGFVKFPRQNDLERELRRINANAKIPTKIRLQVFDDSTYVVRVGERNPKAEYDRLDAGFWGYGELPGIVNGKPARISYRTLSVNLIAQCQQAHANVKRLKNG